MSQTRSSYDLPINEYQLSTTFNNVKTNANPIRNHPGSHIRFPGATGLGASKGQPTLTLDEVETAFRRYDKHLSVAQNGSRIVFLAQRDHREIWRLDHDANIVDIGIMRLASNGTVMNTQWEKSGRRSKFLVGYPLPAIPTDRPHPVFAMMDELAASHTAVSLPSITAKPTGHVFAPNGTVRTKHSTGKWHISPRRRPCRYRRRQACLSLERFRRARRLDQLTRQHGRGLSPPTYLTCAVTPHLAPPPRLSARSIHSAIVIPWRFHTISFQPFVPSSTTDQRH